MSSPWNKRIEIPWVRVMNVMAFVLSLPSWGILGSVIVRRRWVEDYAPRSLAIAVGCCILSCVGAMLFAGGTERERSRSLRIWFASMPAALILIGGCLWIFYDLCYDFGHISEMH